jgi:hypothetical protein
VPGGGELEQRVRELLAPAAAATERAGSASADATEADDGLDDALSGIQEALLEIARAIDPD